jgi:hypothetical protein
MMRSGHTQDECEKLADRIEAVLRTAPRAINDLVKEVGFSRHAVAARLTALLVAGRVHYTETLTNGGLGKSHLWTVGPAPADELEEHRRVHRERAALRARGSIGMPKQMILKTYPAVDRRDPLVSALFGPAPAARAANE